MLIPFLLCLVVVAKGKGEETENSASQIHQPIADCQFTVHNGGPNGSIVSGTTLNAELYYRIACQRHEGYCLRVSNCTVNNGGNEKPYAIIDENGCSLEPSLFEHVQMEDDFTAGIYNPMPIRFRGADSIVRLFCATTLTPKMGRLNCSNKLCNKWSEFSRKDNEKNGHQFLYMYSIHL